MYIAFKYQMMLLIYQEPIKIMTSKKILPIQESLLMTCNHWSQGGQLHLEAIHKNSS